MVWAAMMIRKLLLIIAAVLAPLAFAGRDGRHHAAWVRRWIEFVAAMIVSKLLLVIILSIGLAVFEGAGQSGGGAGQTATQLAAGSLILMMGGFAPWMAIRMFHFAGDTFHAAHLTVGQASSGGRAVIAAPQKVSSLAWTATSLTGCRLTGRGRSGSVTCCHDPEPTEHHAGAEQLHPRSPEVPAPCPSGTVRAELPAKPVNEADQPTTGKADPWLMQHLPQTPSGSGGFPVGGSCWASRHLDWPAWPWPSPPSPRCCSRLEQPESRSQRPSGSPP